MRTPAQRSRRSHRAPTLVLVVSLLGLFGAELADPPMTVACSCAMPGSLKEFARPEVAIFTGTAGGRDGRGVAVEVERWLWGVGAARHVWLSKDSFGDGASCGTTPPPPGSRWIWVAWRPEGDGDFGTGLCSPAGDLATPEGRELLAEAEATFDDGVVVPPDPATDPTRPPDPPPAEAPEPDPATDARNRAGLTILALLVGGSVVLFGGVVLIARRGSRPSG